MLLSPTKRNPTPCTHIMWEGQFCSCLTSNIVWRQLWINPLLFQLWVINLKMESRVFLAIQFLVLTYLGASYNKRLQLFMAIFIFMDKKHKFNLNTSDHLKTCVHLVCITIKCILSSPRTQRRISNNRDILWTHRTWNTKWVMSSK